MSDDDYLFVFEADDDEETCPTCGRELVWDAGERMMFCPDEWQHGPKGN